MKPCFIKFWHGSREMTTSHKKLHRLFFNTKFNNKPIENQQDV